MSWNNLTLSSQLNEIKQNSYTKAQIIFKHSTRCPTSSFAKRILEQEITDELLAKANIHFLDLIAFRGVSNAITELFNIQHESPQILYIKDGACVYHASHSDVSFEPILAKINEL